jgi:hypothetical protein
MSSGYYKESGYGLEFDLLPFSYKPSTSQVVVLSPFRSVLAGESSWTSFEVKTGLVCGIMKHGR